VKILLVIYDNDYLLPLFPQGVAYITTILEQEGYEVDFWHQDIYHYDDDELRVYLDNNHYDIVGISLIAGYYQYQKLLGLSEAINKSKNRPIYIIGGYGPTPEPEFFLRKTEADIVVLGEGEETSVELFAALANRTSLKDIKGIAFRDGDKVTVNERRGVIEDIDSIPLPAYHKFPMDVYRLYREVNMTNTDFMMPMMSGRGCPFKCTFCYRMDPGFRARSTEGIMEEVKMLNKDYGINFFAFYDDLLMCSGERTEEIAEAFLKADLNVKWNCNGRLNWATPKILDLMKRSGCVFINYGIESMDNQVLKNMKKGLNSEMVIRGVEATIDADISPGLNIIFGNYGDNRETLEKSVEFLLKYEDFAQFRTIRPVTPYPGAPLYYDAIANGLLEGPEDFYERKHLNSDLIAVNFTDMSDEEFYECLNYANKRLSTGYYEKREFNVHKQIDFLYNEHDTSFRGFRHA
jgi:radical SAM superfamily enzyme YgiQ (UPF0313 family)